MGTLVVILIIVGVVIYSLDVRPHSEKKLEIGHLIVYLFYIFMCLMGLWLGFTILFRLLGAIF